MRHLLEIDTFFRGPYGVSTYVGAYTYVDPFEAGILLKRGLQQLSTSSPTHSYHHAQAPTR